MPMRRTLSLWACLVLGLALTACEPEPEDCFEQTGNLVQVTSDTMTVDHQEAEMHPAQPVVLFSSDYWGEKDVAEIDGVRAFALIDVPQGLESRSPRPRVVDNGARRIVLGTLPQPSGLPHADADDSQKKSPTWHPDGTRFAGIVNDGNGIERLYIFTITDLVGSSGRTNIDSATYIDDANLSADGNWYYSEPAFSPDGNWIAYVRFYFVRGSEDLGIDDVFTLPAVFAYNLNTGAVVQVTEEAGGVSAPTWSPAGDRIAYASREAGILREVYSIAFDPAAGTPRTDTLRRLTTTNSSEADAIPVESFDPVWLGSGNIVFTSTRRAPCSSIRDRNIWIMGGDGSDPRTLSFSRSDDDSPGQASFINDQTVLFSSRRNPVDAFDGQKSDLYLLVNF